MNSNVEFYEAFAADYEHYYAAVDAAATVGQWLTLIDAEQLVPPAEVRRTHPPRLLDLGCGPGWHLSAWRTAGFRVTGLDASPAMLRLAAQNGAGSETEIPLYCADVCDGPSLRSLANEFDCIVSHFNFLNLFAPSELEAVFGGVATLLRNGGLWLTDTSMSPTCHSAPLLETADGWKREVTSRSPGTVTVLWQRGNAALTERYWLHKSDSFKAAAAKTGLRLQLAREWHPSNPHDAWKSQLIEPLQKLLIFAKPLAR